MKRLIILFVAVMGTFAANAQEASEKVLTLSLEEAEQFAVDHNRTLANAAIDVQKAQANKWKAIASMLPQVKGTVDYSNYFGYRMSIGGMDIAMPPYANLGVTSSVAFNGVMAVSVGMAKISRKMADISLKKSERDIRDQVKELYFSALVTESSLALLKENLKSMNKLYEVTQNSVNVGVAEQTSADQLKVQAASMEATINSTERALEMVYNMMRLQLTLDEDVKIVLTQTVNDLLDLEYIDSLMSETLELDRNYDYQLLKNSTELARKQVTASSLSNTPTLSVFHQYTYKHYFSNEMTMNMTPPNMMGVSLSIPIFTSLANTASHKDAKLAYDKQLNTLMDTELALKVQHSQMVFNLKSAVEKYHTQRQGFEVAQRVFDNVTKKYEHGIASSLDVTNAGTNLINAQASYVQSVLEIVEDAISLSEILNK